MLSELGHEKTLLIRKISKMLDSPNFHSCIITWKFCCIPRYLEIFHQLIDYHEWRYCCIPKFYYFYMYIK